MLKIGIGYFQGDGLPLLHIAVLCRFEELVQVMLEDVDAGQDVNGVRDQFGRTALHYAYASVNSFNITRLLINAGCTEAVFDMVCIYLDCSINSILFLN